MKTIKNIKELKKFTKNTKKYIITYIFLSFIVSLVGIIFPIYTSMQLIHLTNGVFSKVIMCAGVILIISIVEALVQLFISMCTQKFSRIIIKRIQVNIAEEILKIKTENIDNKSNGLFIQRLTNDASNIADIFTFGISSINHLIIELGVFVIVYLINFWIGLYFSSFIIVLFIFGNIRVKMINKIDKKYRDQKEKTSGFATELIRGIRDIKMLNSEVNFLSAVKTDIHELNTTNYKLSSARKIFGFVYDCIYALYTFILLLLIVFLCTSGRLSLPLAIVIYNYRHYISSIISTTNMIIDYLRNFNLSFERIMEIFNGEEFSKERFGNKHLDNVQGNFEFKDVEFSYGQNQVLAHLNFKVCANETVGFVGKSGAGKTTIFNLLIKMYDVDSGLITIDGHDIQELDKDSIRGNITIISQNPYIFNMSIKDNLRLVMPNLTDEEMVEACKLACLDDYINTLPDKYDTIIGEGGVNLSGGQRQRLAIARAFVQKTEIILFDEATSALDNETQAKIQQSIDNLKKDYTLLIIAHRLSTIINCDRILYIDNGRVIAEGTHSRLLRDCREYRELYESEVIIKEK